MLEILKKQPLCHQLSENELKQLASLGVYQTFEKETALVKEDECAEYFYILVKGRVHVTKRAKNKQEKEYHHLLRQLTPGAIMGEMALIDNETRSANLIAKASTLVIKFAIADVKKNTELFAALARALAKTMTERLRYTNEVTLASMSNELEKRQQQIKMGVMIVSLLWLISAYSLILSMIPIFQSLIPATAVISTVLLAVIAVLLFLSIIKNVFPLHYFGLTLTNAKTHIVEACLYALPLFILCLVGKWIFLKLIGSNEALFTPANAYMENGKLNLTLFLMSWLAYLLLVPMQEFVARGTLQTAITRFLPGEGLVKEWHGIVLSNLIFATLLAHVNFLLAIAALIPGLFWGWLFNKQHSLIGVSVSHFLVGSFVLFVLGVPSSISMPHVLLTS